MTFVVSLYLWALVAPSTIAEMKTDWQQWKNIYGKVYSSAQENDRRFGIFQANVIAAAELSRRNPLADFGANQFSDFTDEEFKKTRAAYTLAIQRTRARQNSSTLDLFGDDSVRLAASDGIDWRDHGAVTAVKDQGDCGGCWAFSAIANIEGQWAIKNKVNATALSEQELISCDDYFPCMGCSSGEQTCGWEFLKSEKKGKVATEASYPYTSGNNKVAKCHGSGVTGATIKGYKSLPASEGQMSAWCLENGPIAVAAYALPWKQYKGGIMTTGCNGALDHAVLIAGFGTDAGQQYWLIKNSWGPGWGEEGYIRIARGHNLCKIAAQPNTCTV